MRMEGAFICVLFLLNIHQINTRSVQSFTTEDRLDQLENLLKDVFVSLGTNGDHINRILSSLGSQQDIISGLGNHLKTKRQSPIVVGFTAELSAPLSNLTDLEIIKCDKEITNVGGAYSPQTGQFICPENGLYEFAAAIVSTGHNKTVETEIVLEGRILIKIHSTGYHLDTGTQVVVVECTEGQKVWLRHHAGALSKASVAPRSYFSGHFVHSD